MPFCMLWGQLRSLPLTSPFPTLIRVVIKQPGARNHTDVNNYACQLEVHRVMIGVIDFRLGLYLFSNKWHKELLQNEESTYNGTR